MITVCLLLIARIFIAYIQEQC